MSEKDEDTNSDSNSDCGFEKWGSEDCEGAEEKGEEGPKSILFQKFFQIFKRVCLEMF